MVAISGDFIRCYSMRHQIEVNAFDLISAIKFMQLWDMAHQMTAVQLVCCASTLEMSNISFKAHHRITGIEDHLS
jgi:hypothetical protein